MENIRITSGEFRGRAIKSPRSSFTHPMGSREKIALFNMISEYLVDARVLDAFAGSGSLGIEALSRGARKVVFVEKNAKVARVIKENLENIGLGPRSTVLVEDINKYTTDESFDLIIADPPYNSFKTEEIVGLTNYLKDGGILVLSHPEVTPEIKGLKLTKSHKYAAASLSIYRKIA
ncbi:16S rRNA (guanine(966)-N(2))-methyltransferase RsmD [Candidatus Saccharibacteria bacterium]|nr:16S rRNA (guanine(966)-N(2))-methyltransferase RsmD [Candidatus Saccharibacteria bacterium]